MNLYVPDTIAAISTPLGEGGIGIVRLSGPKSIGIAKSIFAPSKAKKLNVSHQLLHGWIKSSNGEVIDEVLVAVMKAPHSYTREDVVEIQCHASTAVLRQILEIVVSKGARLAEPGEFTKRAFLNGRIDLTQAEAVADLIRAKTTASARLALSQLKGELSQKLTNLRNRLLDLLAEVEARIDFSDEEIEPSEMREIYAQLKPIKEQLEELINQSVKGKLLREGIKIALIGRRNVGKSSLLNALVGQERVIVSPVPGTTRDIISEELLLADIQTIIMDTAGIGSPQDQLESHGMRFSHQSIKEADLILWLVAADTPLQKDDLAIADKIKDLTYIPVVNKCDLSVRIDKNQLRDLVGNREPVFISALRGDGIKELENQIAKLVFDNQAIDTSALIISNVRHQKLLEDACKSISRALAFPENQHYEELIAVELNQAIDSLSKITGDKVDGELLNRIFSRFCIGK